MSFHINVIISCQEKMSSKVSNKIMSHELLKLWKSRNITQIYFQVAMLIKNSAFFQPWKLFSLMARLKIFNFTPCHVTSLPQSRHVTKISSSRVVLTFQSLSQSESLKISNFTSHHVMSIHTSVTLRHKDVIWSCCKVRKVKKATSRQSSC